MVEDLPHRTLPRRLRGVEIETANLRLVTTMANAAWLMGLEMRWCPFPPTSNCSRNGSPMIPEFRFTLEVALADGIKRISRLINQMRFLARDSAFSSMEAFPMQTLIEDAYQEAQKHQSAQAPKLEYKNGVQPSNA